MRIIDKNTENQTLFISHYFIRWNGYRFILSTVSQIYEYITINNISHCCLSHLYNPTCKYICK